MVSISATGGGVVPKLLPGHWACLEVLREVLCCLVVGLSRGTECLSHQVGNVHATAQVVDTSSDNVDPFLQLHMHSFISDSDT